MNVEFEPRTGKFLAPDIVAVVTSDDSRTYLFRSDYVELPSSVKVAYDAVSDCHWIAKTEDGSQKAAMKRDHYGTLILETKLGVVQITGLNQAVFPIMSFFRWYLGK